MLDFGFYNMDCMVGMKEFPDKYFDLAIVDPPYGINVKSGFGRRKGDRVFIQYDPRVTWDKEIPRAEYFEELRRVSENQIIWGGNYFTEHLPPSNSWIVWDKNYGTDELTFSMAELAWTSYTIPVKTFCASNNAAFSKKIHPTQKPVALYKWILNKYAKPGDVILDTHVGSASSLIACRECGFKYVGFEIDEDYFKLAQQRLQAAENQMTIFDYNPYQE